MVQLKRANAKPSSGSPFEPVEPTPQEWAELTWLAEEGPPSIARRAQVVLLWTRGETVHEIARRFQVHRSTVRRWIQRFAGKRIPGLTRDCGARPRRARVESNVRDAIIRIAVSSPKTVGEPFDSWSLRRLQRHVLGRGLVKHLSVEGLRQLLRGVPLPCELWQRKRTQPLVLSSEQRAILEQIIASAKPEVGRRAHIVLARANGLQEAEIAAAVAVAPSSVRYWLRRFRVHGVLGIQAPRKPPRPTRFTPEIRRKILAVASSPPADWGVPRDHWSLRSLRAALVQRAVVKNISIQHLRRILCAAGLQLAVQAFAHERPRQATA